MTDHEWEAALDLADELRADDILDRDSTICAGCGNPRGALDARGYCWACQKEAA